MQVEPMPAAGAPLAPLPVEVAVWAEANAALLDHLRCGEPAHSLQRLARACAQLLNAGQCRIEALPATPDGVFEATRAGGAGGTPWEAELTHLGAPVGRFVVSLDAATARQHLAALLQPLLEAAATLLAAWLTARGDPRGDTLSLVRAAMREGGIFVWEWDLATDSLGDIDEGARMLGYPPQTLGHRQADWDRLIHPDDAAAVEAAYQAHARGKTDTYRVRYRARAADGSWRWIEERGRIVARDAQGRPSRMFGTQSDATVQHELELAREQQLAAEAANAAKTQFLSRVSHELRTPLNAVLGFAQLLETDRQEPLSPGQRRRVQLIRQAGDYLLAMIGDLLDLSLVESGGLPTQIVPVALAPLVRDCLDLLRHQAVGEGVVLVQGELGGLAVRADETRLKQVLFNLLGNGIKYNRPGGSVAVAARAEGGRVILEVRDTGVGLPEDQLHKLFMPFQRLGREAAGVEGSGLGLALSQSLVQAMGGRLSAHALPAGEGPGSVFRLELPPA